jgi:pyruvate/2-oxoglutarate dehydrogenase complex dihydrolipoamide acyltransferase (E2) component
MKVSLKLPRLSMNMEEGTVVSWLKREGDTFSTGDILYSVETEKAVADVEAPCGGVVLEILVAEGANVEVGAAVCRIDTKS